MIENKKKHLKIYLMVILTIMTIFVSTQSLAVSKVEGLTVKMEGEKARLEWQALPDASRYDVYVSVSGTGYKYLGSTSGNRASIKGFTPDTVYQVMIRALLKSGTTVEYSNFSEPVSIILKSSLDLELEGGITNNQINIEKVTGLSAQATGTQVTLNWNKVAEADGYEISVEIPNYGIQTFNVTSLRVTLGGVSRSGDYSVKVRGYKIDQTGQKIYGEFSEIVKFRKQDELQPITPTQKPAQVTGLNAKIVSPTIATISWNPASDATHYEIKFVRTENGRTTTEMYMQKVDQGAQCSIEIKQGGSYIVTVTAYKLTNTGKIYGETSKEVSFKIEQAIQKLAQVTGLKYKVTGEEVKLDWNKVEGAEGYEIDFGVPGIPNVTLNATTNGRTVSGLTETKYNYSARVRAYKTVNGQKIYGEYSKTVKFTGQDMTPAQVTGLTRKLTETTVTFNWNKMSNVDGYEITLVVPRTGTYTYETTKNTKTLSNIVIVNSDYVATVKAYKVVNGKKLYGPASKELRFRGGVNTASKPTATLSGTNLTLKWPVTKGAEGYEILLTAPGGKTFTYSTTGTSKIIYNIGDLKKDYTVKIRAYRKDENGKKVYGAYSPEIRFRGKVGTVTGLKSTVTGTALKLNWNSVYNAEGYEVTIFVPGIGDFKYTTKTNSYSASNYVTIKGYDFTAKVRAYNKDEKGQTVYGDYSSTVKFRAK